MIATNETKLQKLKKSFLDKLIEALVAILELIETKADIEESYITRATRTAEGLIKICDIEGNQKLKSVFNNILRIIKSREISEKGNDIEKYVEFLKTLNR